MTIENIVKNHPSIIHSADMAEICKPLERMLNINYFAHVNVDSKGNFAALGRNPKFVKHYFASGYHNADVHLSNNDLTEEFVVQDSVVHHGITDKLFSDCSEFGLHHVFTILQRKENSVDAFHFASTLDNHSMNETCLSNITLLKLFILQFKDKVNSDKQLKQAYDFKFKIDLGKGGYESSQKENPQNILPSDCLGIDRFYLPQCVNNSYLTKREFECLAWLYQGKTAVEIAKLLKITERTVRAHVDSIRKKFGCYTLFQVGQKISDSDLIELLMQVV